MWTNCCRAFKNHLSKKYSKMKSLTELALKGHFEQLKEEVNAKGINDQPLALLMKALAYLEKVEKNGLLDGEGEALIHQLRGYSMDGGMLAPKPMKRATGKKKVDGQSTKRVG